MIKLLTDCDKCIHQKVCKNKNNAKNNKERLAALTYGDGPNDDYDWDTMMDHYNVVIAFSCPDYDTKIWREIK